MSRSIKLNLGLSPCPNDTFIFHALLHGIIRLEAPFSATIEPYMADVEKLNSLALENELEITKISVGALPHILDNYMLLSSGAALGWGCGPLVVARKNMDWNEIGKAAIAIPGRMTTANLLLNLHGGFHGVRQEMIFSDVIPSVASGRTELGVIIHEGRFTYQDSGLVKILDLGQWWEDKFHLPLPLGAIAIKRSLPSDLARAVRNAIAASLAHAWKNPEDSKFFIRSNAQEMSEEVTSAHIRTFVTDYSLDLGESGRESIEMLAHAALELENKKLDKEIFLK